jgi:hypothetical protein
MMKRTDGIGENQSHRQIIQEGPGGHKILNRAKIMYGFIEDQEDRRDCTGHRGLSVLYRTKRTNGIIHKRED